MLKYRTGIVSLILAFVLIGCTSPTLLPTTTLPPSPTLTPTPQMPTRLNLAYGTLPTTLDPQRTSDQYAAQVIRFICQGLVDLGDEPLLAKDWQYAPDYMSITFTLRENIKFRDGTPFNAAAVRYSFERLQKPESQESPIYEAFQGVQIETPDAYTVVFKFSEPRNDFIDTLSSEYAVIISPSSQEAEIAQNPVCTGPYYVKSWEPEQFILLTKNEFHTSVPAYFENKGPAYIDEIKILLIETHEERIEALLQDVIDKNDLNTQEDLNKIKERPDDFEIRKGHWLGGITYLGFNYARTPTNELKVRQALAHATDKQALIAAVLADDFAIPAISLLCPRTFGYSDTLEEVEYKFDLEQSRKLLTEAGFADNDGDGILDRNGVPLRLRLLTTQDNIYFDMATVIQNTFAEIGVAVEIQQESRARISEITPTGEFDLLLYDYNWPYPSALNLFLHTEKVGGTNRVAYSNPEVDILLDEIATMETAEDSSDADIQLGKIIAVQRMIIQDVPWQPILARRAVSALNKRVIDVTTHPSGALLWHDAKIVDK